MTQNARPRYSTPRWVKWFAGIIAALIALVVVAVIFGAGEESDDAAPVAPVTAVATATEAVTVTPIPTATRPATPTSTPTPTATPDPVVGTCTERWDRAGEEFTYLPTEQTLSEAQEANCGTLAPVSSVCGTGYENSGDEYTFDPDETTAGVAQVRNCGKKYQRGLWRTGTFRDAVDPSDTTVYAQLPGRWVETPDWLLDDSPILYIQCRSDDGLVVYVTMGGYVGASYGRGVPVEYSFDGAQVVSHDWSELSSNEGAWLQEWRRSDFLARVRANPAAEMVFRIYAYDGTVHGTARFDLTGIELQVDPVLEACGW